MKIFEYIVWIDEKRNKDGDVVDEAEIISGPSVMLANDERVVGLRAARGIPAEYDDNLDRVQVTIRPFVN